MISSWIVDKWWQVNYIKPLFKAIICFNEAIHLLKQRQFWALNKNKIPELGSNNLKTEKDMPLHIVHYFLDSENAQGVWFALGCQVFWNLCKRKVRKTEMHINSSDFFFCNTRFQILLSMFELPWQLLFTVLLAK